MILSALEHIRELLDNLPDARSRAERYITQVLPEWDKETEQLWAFHPDDNERYPVRIEDVNGSLRVHFSVDDDGELLAELDDGSGDWSDTCLVAVFDDIDENTGPPPDRVWFVSEAFTYDWR